MFFLSSAILGAVLTLAPGPGTGAPASIEGTWRAGGDATFEVSLCGDGTQLCARLISLSDWGPSELMPYLGRYIFEDAKPVAQDVWQATAVIGGRAAAAKVSFDAPSQIEVVGCILDDCRTLVLDRVDYEPEP